MLDDFDGRRGVGMAESEKSLRTDTKYVEDKLARETFSDRSENLLFIQLTNSQ